MPLAKVVKGGRGGWCRCDEYITEKEKARVLETNMAGDNPVERSMEYRLCIEKNLRASNTVLHISISPHPDDKIDDQMWCDIARGVRVGLGYQKNQYLFATHEDTGLRHGHLLINRVDVEGKVPTDWLDKRKTEKILRQLEEEFNLTPVTSSWEVAMRSPTTGQIQKAQKEQKQFVEGKRSSPPLPPVIMVLQEIISLATLDKPTLTELLDRLERQDVRTEIKRTPGGIIQGISFGKDGEKFRGSDLNREFSWNGLQKYRGVSVDLVRDAQAIDAAVDRRRETEQLQEQGNGTDRTAKAGSKTASRGTSNSDVSKRRSKGASRSSSSTEPAALQSDEGEFLFEAAVSSIAVSVEEYIRVSIATAASIPDADGSRTEDGKHRLEAAVNQLNKSASHFSRRLDRVDRISREHTEDQSERYLAVAPNGAASTSGGSGEDTGNNRQLVAAELDHFGAAVHEFNAELESPPVRHQAAGDYSRAESREARASNSTTSSTTGWTTADIHRQSEQLNRILDSLKRNREAEIEELEKGRAELKQLSLELAAGTNQVNPTNEPDRAGVEESDSTKGMAGTLDSLSRRNQELAAGIKQLNSELTGETIAPRIKTGLKPKEVSITEEQSDNLPANYLKTTPHNEAQKPDKESSSKIIDKSKDKESVDDFQAQEGTQRKGRFSTQQPPVNPDSSRTIASLIPLVVRAGQAKQSDAGGTSKDTPEDRGVSSADRIEKPIRTAKSIRESAQPNKPDSKQTDRHTGYPSSKSSAVEHSHEPKLEKLTSRQVAAAQRISELAAESQRLEASRHRELEADTQQPSSGSEQPNNINKQRQSPSRKAQIPNLEL